MRNPLIASALLMLVAMFSFLATGCSSRVETADEEAAKTIPDLSGIWEAPLDSPAGGRPRLDVCGEPVCDQLLDKAGKPQTLLWHDVTVEEPQMLPWAEEKYKAARAGVPEAVPVGREEANPWFSACTPLGPSALMLAFFNAVEL